MCLCAFGTRAQQANVWYFGDHAGVDMGPTTPVPLLDGQTYFPPPNGWNEGTSSICDSTGSMLLYSNGEKIWDRDQQVMLNGDSLKGHASSTHAALIVPLPGSDRFFYLFTTDGSENSFQNGLRYNVVDICGNNGRGEVVAGSKNVLLSPYMSEKLAAVKHANGIDTWVISHKYNSDLFKAYLLTDTGVTDSVLTHVGPVDAVGWGGQIVISPSTTQLAYATPSLGGFLALFDLDPNTGSPSNPRVHDNVINDQSYGVAFSPNSNLLYVSTVNVQRVFQYDLNLSNWATIISSRVSIIQSNTGNWRSMLLGPDDRIYITRAQRPYLARIEYPDVVGINCQYVGQGANLGGRHGSWGLPTVLTGYVYSNTLAECDTSLSINSNEISTSTVHPNPVQDLLTITSAMLVGMHSLTIQVHDAAGSLVHTDVVSVSRGSISMDIAALSAGTYHYQVETGTSRIRGTFIKMP